MHCHISTETNMKSLHEVGKNGSTGPRTEEGKQRSSQNAIKHGLFARKLVLLDGETEQQFDELHERYRAEYKLCGATEDGLVRRLTELDWRLKRVFNLEGAAIEDAIEKGDVEGKFLNNYSMYTQRLNRDFQAMLKTIREVQAPRLLQHSQHWREAVLILDHTQRHNIPWEPSEDGFVFSKELLERQLNFNKLWSRMAKQIRIFPTTKYQDEHFSKLAL